MVSDEDRRRVEKSKNSAGQAYWKHSQIIPDKVQDEIPEEVEEILLAKGAHVAERFIKDWREERDLKSASQEEEGLV